MAFLNDRRKLTLATLVVSFVLLFALDGRPSERALRDMAVAWAPWRAVAARHLAPDGFRLALAGREVLRVQVRDVQEARLLDPKVHERRLEFVIRQPKCHVHQGTVRWPSVAKTSKR